MDENGKVINVDDNVSSPDGNDNVSVDGTTSADGSDDGNVCDENESEGSGDANSVSGDSNDDQMGTNGSDKDENSSDSNDPEDVGDAGDETAVANKRNRTKKKDCAWVEGRLFIDEVDEMRKVSLLFSLSCENHF